ncbi:MAG TPA: glycosyltransferase family 8 protein [Dongiaceae bacterium]
MVLPAFYVAAEAARRASGAYDVHVMAEEGELEEAHRRWMDARGIQAIGGLDFSHLRRVVITNTRLTPATMIRLVMPEILAERYDRVLYLDADTEIAGDIGALFGLDLGDAAVAAVPAARIAELATPATRRKRERHFRALGMSEPFRYFNSGVMLIDIARWLEQGIGARALDFVRANAAICRLPDEDALNAVLDGRIADLSPIWNLRSWDMGLPRVTRAIAPVIRHYDGPHKPWKRFARGRRLFSLESPYQRYRAFLAATPWRGWLDRQWSLPDLGANLRFELEYLADRLRGRPTRGVRGRAELRRQFKVYRRYLREALFVDVGQGIAVVRDGRLMLNPELGTGGA